VSVFFLAKLEFKSKNNLVFEPNWYEICNLGSTERIHQSSWSPYNLGDDGVKTWKYCRWWTETLKIFATIKSNASYFLDPCNLFRKIAFYGTFFEVFWTILHLILCLLGQFGTMRNAGGLPVKIIKSSFRCIIAGFIAKTINYFGFATCSVTVSWHALKIESASWNSLHSDNFWAILIVLAQFM
jgi:hypothetical protein